VQERVDPCFTVVTTSDLACCLHQPEQSTSDTVINQQTAMSSCQPYQSTITAQSTDKNQNSDESLKRHLVVESLLEEAPASSTGLQLTTTGVSCRTEKVTELDSTKTQSAVSRRKRKKSQAARLLEDIHR